MWKLNIIIFCVALLFSTSIDGQTVRQPVIIENLAEKLPGRIVNGKQAVLQQFPQQVSLRRRVQQNHFCGGSILTPEWILAAAHCMFTESGKEIAAYSVLVIAGEVALKHSNRARQWSFVTELILHENFHLDTLQNDVALLKLETPLVFDPFVKPSLVVTEPVEPGTFCQVSGWGYPQYEVPRLSGYLMYVDVPKRAFSECKELLYKYELYDGMYCAGYLEGGRDACQGDSGGGMLCNGKLTGVVSGGPGCAWPKLPGLYSDVLYYVPWIKKFVNNLNHTFTTRATPYYRTNASSVSSSSFAVVFLMGIISVIFII